MKILVGIQCEGRGHITQAIALKQMLQPCGINLNVAVVGKKDKPLPGYLSDEFNLIKIETLNFVYNKNGDLSTTKTLSSNITRLIKIVKSLIYLVKHINNEKYDIVINFYEPLVGITALFTKSKYISIGHQYFMFSDNYPRSRYFFIQRFILGIMNKVCSIKSKIIALSYYDGKISNGVVTPPLLRNESYVTSTNTENFILVYLVNEEKIPQLIEVCKQNSNINIVCFTNLTKQVENVHNLKVYQLNNKEFIQSMKICTGVVCTGGFETSSEAIIQNKPLLMVPTPNHYEQICNCRDAENAGFAINGTLNDIPKLLNQKNNVNRSWFNQKTVKDSILKVIKTL